MRSAGAVLAVVVLAAVLAARCSGNSSSTGTTPTSTTTTTTPITEVFVGTLSLGGSSFYSFTVNLRSNVFLTLASLTTGSPSPTIFVPLQLGLGIPAGIGCGLTQSVTIAPALTPQIGVTLDPGIYCVNVADVGNLASAVTFAVRIVHE
jgi:hypothetical protein